MPGVQLQKAKFVKVKALSQTQKARYVQLQSRSKPRTKISPLRNVRIKNVRIKTETFT